MCSLARLEQGPVSVAVVVFTIMISKTLLRSKREKKKGKGAKRRRIRKKQENGMSREGDFCVVSKVTQFILVVKHQLLCHFYCDHYFLPKAFLFMKHLFGSNRKSSSILF